MMVEEKVVGGQAVRLSTDCGKYVGNLLLGSDRFDSNNLQSC